MPRSIQQIAEQFERVVPKLDVRQFYEDYGVTFQGEPDEKGRVAGGILFPTETARRRISVLIEEHGVWFDMSPIAHTRAEFQDALSNQEGEALKRMTVLEFLILMLKIKEHKRKNYWYHAALNALEGYLSKDRRPEPEEQLPPKPEELTSLEQLEDPARADSPVIVPVCLDGESNASFHVPYKYKVTYCQRIQSGACQKCIGKVLTVPPGSEAIIESCGASRVHVERMLAKLACPYGAKCKTEVLEKVSYRQCFVTQHHNRMIAREDPDRPGMVHIDGRFAREMRRTVYIRVPESSSKAFEPRGYKAEGWIRTHPRDSSQTMIIKKLTPIPEPYESFTVDETIKEKFGRMQALGWEGIVQDLMLHRTRMQHRKDLLLITLLTYMSPLQLNFNGQHGRGWLVSAVVGDTAVGKSRTFEVLSGMITYGDIFSCQTGRRTGLCYALDRTKLGGWRVQAGLQALNTRKILCVEESQALPREEIQYLQESIESGVLRVHSVAHAIYETRTRMLFNANPVDSRPLESYSYGVLAMRDLFIPTFIRRMDLVACIRRADADEEDYNAKADWGVANISPEDLRSHVMWAWNLGPDSVLFSQAATDSILEKAGKLASRFGQSDEIPLLLPTVSRWTVARVSAAYAVLDLSTEDEYEHVTVAADHVDAAVGLLERLYTHPDCGLDRWSLESRRRGVLEDYPVIEKALLLGLDMQNPKTLEKAGVLARTIHLLRRGDVRSVPDYAAMIGKPVKQVAEAMGMLKTHSLVHEGVSGKVIITPKFHRLMEKFSKVQPLAAAVIDQASGKE